uniref:G protein-coupled receptor 34b n=1 Tax=Hucho hucho TaxID=62062 RepID=A0A4W5KKG6_9TELE
MMNIFPANVTAFPFSNSSHPLVTTEKTFTTLLPMIPDPREHCHLDDSSLRIPLAVLYSVLFVLGLTGNILALWVFLYVHSKNNSVRVFLINVALADLLLVIYLPFRVSAICGMIWVLALASVIPMILLSEGNEESDKWRQRAKGKAYFNLFLVATFWLVFVCFMVSYGKIGLKLLRMSREKPDFPNAPRYTRTARKLFFVLFLFTVCFVPYHMVRVFYVVSQISDTSCFWRGVVDKANEVVLLLSALNSCLDPVMYFLLSASVRKETLRLINNVFRLRDPESSVDRGRSLGDLHANHQILLGAMHSSKNV